MSAGSSAFAVRSDSQFDVNGLSFNCLLKLLFEPDAGQAWDRLVQLIHFEAYEPTDDNAVQVNRPRGRASGLFGSGCGAGGRIACPLMKRGSHHLSGSYL